MNSSQSIIITVQGDERNTCSTNYMYMYVLLVDTLMSRPGAWQKIEQGSTGFSSQAGDWLRACTCAGEFLKPAVR